MAYLRFKRFENKELGNESNFTTCPKKKINETRFFVYQKSSDSSSSTGLLPLVFKMLICISHLQAIQVFSIFLFSVFCASNFYGCIALKLEAYTRTNVM